ncbi:GNAT family N-acetyltransferase [Thalassococcus sp. S3]|uniref:GNAT family N-acetyltransferase n=1 Tax=Thalassococcus sp. S3 TaxID=2017482 RepID=UPI0010240EE2|nr:GNAT family N-acetyltransferase [Thalassococcus sp. S3]QBF29935.1 GNAT family N-acetyltransferase [Thalassococcus sp. S3]
MTVIPTLETERLLLRAPTLSDYPAYEAFYASPRAAGAGGQSHGIHVWRQFAALSGHWHLLGFGWWIIEYEGAPAGFCGLHNPPQKALPELGWAVYAHAEGKGIAFEATSAALAYAHRSGRFPHLASYIINGNTRSEALARRLGARPGRPAQHGDNVTEWLHEMGEAA